MGVLPNHLGHGSGWQYCIIVKYYVIPIVFFFFFFFFIVPFSHCDKLIRKKFMMYIVSYNSVQNGLAYFKCLYIYMYVL